MPVVWAALVWLAVGLLVIRCRARKRRESHLVYDDATQVRRVSGLQGLAQSFRVMGESASRAVWGSGTPGHWRRRCEASLAASRRRRGLR